MLRKMNLLSTMPTSFYGASLTLILACTCASAQVTNASFSGTYTLLFGLDNEYIMQLNMFNQQVGFCPPGGPPAQLPFGYSCASDQDSHDLLTGTIVADGNGNIITGSTYTFTRDPNEYKCAARHNAVSPCPYKVPSGNTWNSSTPYVVGNVVDSTVGGVLLTFQAVENNTGVPPNGSTCTASVQPPNCTWDRVYATATSGLVGTQAGTLSGTYSLQSDGSGVMTLTASGQKNQLMLAIVVPAAPLAVGQVVGLQSMASLTNEVRGSGTAVRSK